MAERFEKLYKDYPELAGCRVEIENAFSIMKGTYENGGRVYVCGNGGSAADCQHITGELMKGFEKKRPVEFPAEIAEKLSPETARLLGEKLQGALPCHSLTVEGSLISALANDISADIAYAQQIHGYGKPGDCLVCISTSGNAVNVGLAAELAIAMDIGVIALTGRDGGRLGGLRCTAVRVPADTVAGAQELHVAVYHALCRELENHFFEC